MRLPVQACWRAACWAPARRAYFAGMLYGVSAGDALAWAAAIGILLSASALANFVPARRATLIDPSTAMRID